MLLFQVEEVLKQEKSSTLSDEAINCIINLQYAWSYLFDYTDNKALDWNIVAI